MHAADAAGDYLRLAERYRQMKDPELLLLLRQRDELTDLARQALDAEAHHRRLKLDPEPPEPPPIPETTIQSFQSSEAADDANASAEGPTDSPDEADEDSGYEEDRRLVEIRTVWSLRDALQVQGLLDRAGIPFFMGPEKATGVADVKSNFSKGVSVQVMKIGIPWAAQAMADYYPKDEPPEAEEVQIQEAPVCCPRCQSTEVIFNRLTAEPPGALAVASGEPEFPPSLTGLPPKFDWTCDVCGYEWQDDGLSKERR
jgi:hypothetical protein